jgi:hypothetical protein
MTIVRVLVDHVGNWMAGDIVEDAPAGLVNMAAQAAKHAVTGELLAEIVSGSADTKVSEEIAILNELTEKAILYGVPDAETLSITQLISAIVQAEWDQREQEAVHAALLLKQKVDQDAADAELSGLKDKAKELKIPGYTKMEAEELKVAIAAAVAAGGELDAK